MEFIFGLGETFHKHTHTYIFVAFLGTGNNNSHLIALNNLWKKKMSTNVMIHWLGGWVSQTHEVENNNNTILDILGSENQIKHLRRN